jgi:hypothetical protein
MIGAGGRHGAKTQPPNGAMSRLLIARGDVTQPPTAVGATVRPLSRSLNGANVGIERVVASLRRFARNRAVGLRVGRPLLLSQGDAEKETGPESRVDEAEVCNFWRCAGFVLTATSGRYVC